MDLLKVLNDALPKKNLVYMIRRKSDGAFKCKHTYRERWTTRKGAGAVFHVLGAAMTTAKNSLRWGGHEPGSIEIVEFKMTENSTLDVKL